MVARRARNLRRNVRNALSMRASVCLRRREQFLHLLLKLNLAGIELPGPFFQSCRFLAHGRSLGSKGRTLVRKLRLRLFQGRRLRTRLLFPLFKLGFGIRQFAARFAGTTSPVIVP